MGLLQKFFVIGLVSITTPAWAGGGGGGEWKKLGEMSLATCAAPRTRTTVKQVDYEYMYDDATKNSLEGKIVTPLMEVFTFTVEDLGSKGVSRTSNLIKATKVSGYFGPVGDYQDEVSVDLELPLNGRPGRLSVYKFQFSNSEFHYNFVREFELGDCFAN